MATYRVEGSRGEAPEGVTHSEGSCKTKERRGRKASEALFSCGSRCERRGSTAAHFVQARPSASSRDRPVAFLWDDRRTKGAVALRHQQGAGDEKPQQGKGVHTSVL